MDHGPDEPNSGEPRSNSRRTSQPRTQRELKITALTGLMLLYPDNRLSPEEWKVRLRAYLEDLERYPAAMVEQAIRAGRRHWKFFPSIPEILEQTHAVQNGAAGTGGMGMLGWDRYKAWLQSTGRLSSRPYSPAQLAYWLSQIPDREMARLGTPRTKA